MPNWCCNRLRVSGRSEDIGQVRALFAGGGYPSYARAAAEGVQLFLAGCAGILRPADGEHYAPYPALTGAKGYPSCAEEGRDGHHDVSGNQAFTQWLCCLREGTVLTDAACDDLHALWLESGLRDRRWNDLTPARQECIVAVFAGQRHDWCGSFSATTVQTWWDTVCDGLPELKAQPLDLLMVLPPRLDVEINGFNGRLLAGVPSGYDWYTHHYGTKWPRGYDLNICNGGEDWLAVDFDTPWSPPSESLLAALSGRYGVTVEHWYAERGCDYCGYALYSDGEQAEACCDSLEWSEEEDEDGFREVTGPAWIVDNVAHFGG
ncbi:DUF1281 domain-containing protein [Pantoea sp. At-9b]|uniref:DUF1281 domain-containing protein n=1 Tax=Pantoea sp. (strain At-9b) TaxID=592316 RepID=UPI0001B3F579|nr:DUF1281 domain-containing protein [Pantoea sp. At-9b]ADU73026.1 protein of unknown function DUF1281 [Pantoea sp. At-9b]